jgi:C1A family cysteine protease
MEIDEIKIISDKIKQRGHNWSAGSTSMSDLSREEQVRYLGLVVTDEEKRAISEKVKQEERLAAQMGFVFVSPSQWDWRNISKNNWTTAIKNQAGCGACVAFATVGAIESNLKIFKRSPSQKFDLSEADLFFRGCGNCCGTGWNFVPALRYAKSSGIPDEACFPYDGDDEGPCTNRDQRAIKIDSWRVIYSASQAKEWISTKGPLITGMEVYSDFFCYFDGIYVPEYGDMVGYHAVCVVGYNDVENCWICKNSWGTGWGEDGWFRIAYGECGIGSEFPFYTTEFKSTCNDLIMPKGGRVLVRFKSKGTAFDNDISLHYPSDKPLFRASSSNVGRIYDAGTFTAGSRLGFALKTPDPNGHIYYTDSSLNADGCDHVRVTQLGTYKWELRWEDIFLLAEQDFNDVVMEVEITDKINDDITIPKNGKIIARLKSKSANNQVKDFRLSNTDTLIFNSQDPKGKAADVGAFTVGTKIGFSISTFDRNVYYTDSALNGDSCTHAKVFPTGLNKWELRWEDRYGLSETDYSDLVVGLELVPSINNDIIMPMTGSVMARFLSKRTSFENEFMVFSPTPEQSIFVANDKNLGRTFNVGQFSAGSRLVFALRTPQNRIYYTDSSLNIDTKSHVYKLPVGPNRWQLRWEDLYDLADKDYNDLVVEISIVASRSEYLADSNLSSDQVSRDMANEPMKSIDGDISPSVPTEIEQASLSASISSSVTGNTTDYYVAVLVWNCLSYVKKTLILACTNSSNDLKYRIRGYAKSNSNYYDEIRAETTLSHGGVQPFVIENIYNVIVVEVKSKTLGQASSYTLDYCGGV